MAVVCVVVTVYYEVVSLLRIMLVSPDIDLLKLIDIYNDYIAIHHGSNRVVYGAIWL